VQAEIYEFGNLFMGVVLWEFLKNLSIRVEEVEAEGEFFLRSSPAFSRMAEDQAFRLRASRLFDH